MDSLKTAVIIPAYRVKRHIGDLLKHIGPEAWRIYVVDDACPEESGRYVEEHVTDPRVRVLRHTENQGVGGAVLTGFQQAMEDGADILVKLDGDGQMDPALLPRFIGPVARGQADYAKGNRFHRLDEIHRMPKIRLLGNAALSFMTKFSSGYWTVFDPNNGYVALSTKVARLLPLDKIHRRYFFESDMLFRLGTVRAMVVDVPMDAVYGDEQSGMNISREIGRFFVGHVRNAAKRIFYNYFLRDMSAGSLELLAGVAMMGFGSVYGAAHWLSAMASGTSTPAGTVMLSALPMILGLQFLLAFLNGDIASVPATPLQNRL